MSKKSESGKEGFGRGGIAELGGDGLACSFHSQLETHLG